MSGESKDTQSAPRVVVVDDDPLVLAVTRRFLQRAGYAVSPCDHGRAALREVVQSQPFALVADLHMPDMSGAELLQLSRECSPQTRRVLYTGEAQVTELARSLTPQVAEAIVAKVDGPEYLPAALDGLRADSTGEVDPARARGLAMGMARALASAHLETLDHALRLARWSRRLGEVLGFSGHDLIDLEAGALLHDIGMVAVPEVVFRTKGPLTEAQWEQVRQHPGFGAQMLQSCEVLSGAAAVVRSHHEHYDGRGYPERLRAEEIPLSARVFALTDAYEAITHDRAYQPACSDEQARSEIRRHAGGQFDPVVVDAFMSVPVDEWRRPLPAGSF